MEDTNCDITRRTVAVVAFLNALVGLVSPTNEFPPTIFRFVSNGYCCLLVGDLAGSLQGLIKRLLVSPPGDDGRKASSKIRLYGNS